MGRSCASTAVASVIGSPSANAATNAERGSNRPRPISACTLRSQFRSASPIFDGTPCRWISTELRPSGPMIGMASQYCCGPVKLLQQHDPHQLVRPGGRAEGQSQFSLIAQGRRQPVGAANHEDHCRPAVTLPLSQPGGESCAMEILALTVERDHDGALRDHVGESDRFFQHALARVVGAAFPYFDDLDIAQAKVTAGLRHALPIAFGKLGFRALLQTSNRGHDDTHRAAKAISLIALAPHGRKTTSFPGCRSYALPA